MSEALLSHQKIKKLKIKIYSFLTQQFEEGKKSNKLKTKLRITCWEMTAVMSISV